MLERQYGKLVFMCDRCNDTLDTDTDEFRDALATLNREAWKAMKVGDEWQHYCPGCRRGGPR